MKVLTTKPLPLPVVAKIKDLLKDSPREAAWFQLSINTAFRGGDILNLTFDNLQTRRDGKLEIITREKKTKKIRTVLVNDETRAVLHRWITVHPRRTNYIFEGHRGKMRTGIWSVRLKEWCKEVGYEEPRTATHSLRKTFSRTHYERGAKIETLMVALRHSSPAQTLQYICVLPEEINALYEDAI